MTVDPVQTAWRTAALAPRVAGRIQQADQWLHDHTPDGYPANTWNTQGSSNDPARSPVSAAIETTQLLNIAAPGQPQDLVDLRTIRTRLHTHLDNAHTHLELAQRLLTAIPQTPTGNITITIDYELRTSRCEGWGDKYATCDDLDVKTSTVDGSTIRLCGRCYKAMWRATTNDGNRGRTTHAGHVA